MKSYPRIRRALRNQGIDIDLIPATNLYDAVEDIIVGEEQAHDHVSTITTTLLKEGN